MFGVVPQAFLHDRPEIAPEFGVIPGVFRAVLQFAQYAGDQRLADTAQDGGDLQHLAGDVERQVFRVHHAADEAQPVRQQAGFIGDEHAPDVQTQMRVAIAFDHVERFHAGDEQETKIFEHPLGAPMQRCPWLVEEMAQVAVEFLEVLFADLGFRFPPERGAFVGGFVLAVAGDGDRQGDVIGPFADDGFQAHRLQEFFRVRFHVQDDFGARGVFLRWRQGELPRALGRPNEGFFGPGSTRRDFDTVGDHEGGIEADAKLADQAGAILGVGRGEFFAEGFGAGAGDGAKIVDQVLARHADAVVGDQDGAGLFVRHDADFRFRGRGEFGIGQGFEAAAIAGVGGVGHKFAQENLAFGVERMDDEVQEAADFGAKAVFFHQGIVHRGPPCRGPICARNRRVSICGVVQAFAGGPANKAASALRPASTPKQISEVS